MKTLSIVVAQINCRVGDISGNAKLIIEHAAQAVDRFDADLVIFPELTLTGYPPEDLLLRPELYTQCSQAIEFILSHAPDTALMFGTPAQHDNKTYNQTIITAPNKIIATYQKQRLPNYAVFDERRYFSAGKSPCVFKLNGMHIGVLICEDMWHPPTVAATVDAGAEILTCINASPFDSQKAAERLDILTNNALTTHTPIIYCNLVGGQDELVFDGGSQVINQHGEHVGQAAYFKPDLLPITIKQTNNERLIESQIVAQPAHELEKIYQALVLGTRDYILKNGFKGAIIGLSGGIDSALTLAIAVDALGAEHVTAVMMPSDYTASMSVEDAAEEARTLEVNYHCIAIADLFKQYLATLAPIFKDAPADSTEENLQARIRGNLLMALSNKTGRLVLTTGNKSELSVGYATLYGDMVGGFAPLKDIAKTQVYALCAYRNSVSAVIPQRVIDRPPSAELAPNQVDQDTLPPYDILDEILKRSVELDQSPAEIEQAGFDKQTIQQVINMVDRNEYKRQQAPVGVRVTRRAFGKDRRYPITSRFISQEQLDL